MNNPEFMQIAQMSKEEARKLIEQLRWPNGAVCPHCGSNKAYTITPKEGSSTRPGLYKCKECTKQFTVTVGTIFEGSRIPLNKWLMAIYLMCASKKGISAHQLHRQLKITYKSAWFMCHRIRYAMTQEPMFSKIRGTVEADETYIGGKERNKHLNKRTKNAQGRSAKSKVPVAVLVERAGRVRAKKVADVSGKTLKGHIRKHVDKSARIVTDEWLAYQGLDKEFAGHDTVDHGRKEYVRGDVYTNTAESWIALLKRGVIGTFHHVSEQHLDRYVDEFAFRWDNRIKADGERFVEAVKSVEGKRLIYKELK